MSGQSSPISRMRKVEHECQLAAQRSRKMPLFVFEEEEEEIVG